MFRIIIYRVIMIIKNTDKGNEMKLQDNLRRISSFQIIILGFLFVILIGGLLLMLPVSTQDGRGAGLLDAFFTSVSATCVTGLVVQNTAEYWSLFGQIVILCLIQIGGMGVVTVAIAIAICSGKKIGLLQRSTMQEAISAPQMGGIVKLTGFILKAMLMIELTGAICLAPTFCKRFGVKGIWYALFHAISAFCNAGFDLMGNVNGQTSLMQFVGNPFVNLPIMILIIVGGLGFLTWEDIWNNKYHIRRYRMQSKVVLLTTAILLIGSGIYYFFFEFQGEAWAELSSSERVWAALFQAVTPRTAGFNTVDLAQMNDGAQVVTIILMLIGGSSGSTAGGCKVTTLAVLFLTVWTVFRHNNDVQVFGRRIPYPVIYNAIAIFVLYLVLFLTGGIAISYIDNVPLLPALFEAASAIGTVGLSLGLTSELGDVSRIILIILMFLGRIGGLTFIFAVISEKHPSQSKFPEEKITVG